MGLFRGDNRKEEAEEIKWMTFLQKHTKLQVRPGVIRRVAVMLSLYGMALILIGGLLLGLRYNAGFTCPVKYYTGFDCPGCGGTRMVMALLNLDFEQAFRYNALLFITGVPLVLLALQQTYVYILTAEFSLWLDKVLIVYIVMLISFAIIRNVGPFRWLQATKIR